MQDECVLAVAWWHRSKLRQTERIMPLCGVQVGLLTSRSSMPASPSCHQHSDYWIWAYYLSLSWNWGLVINEMTQDRWGRRKYVSP
jgi:hypothetical protein